MPKPLSKHELEILRQFENAGMLRDLKQSPGWIVLKELAAQKIQDVRELYEGTRMDKDATWLAHGNLKGLKEFWGGLVEIVENAQDLLDPEAMKRIVEGQQLDA